MNIVAICGSLREKSLNKALALYAKGVAGEALSIEILDIAGLPLYNEDVEKSAFPPEASAFKEKIAAADGVLFFTPEFNRGMPGVLKNAIDWSSRPSGEHPWQGKPVGVLGVSSGPRGTIVAQYDLKRTLTYFGAHVLGQPEFYVDNSDKKITEDGVADEKTKEYVAKYVAAFKAHVEKLS